MRISGEIERRLLVNYRVDPDVAARRLPAPFRPQLTGGHAVAGICLIRLGSMRPGRLPAAVGLRSENAAHRFAVEWDVPGGTRSGVYVPRRDTSSWTTVALGGRIFPGRHHRARFHVTETPSRIRVRSDSVDVAGEVTADFGPSSLFGSLDEASAFFACSGLGYSPGRRPDRYDGLTMHPVEWTVESFRIDHAYSSYFDDPAYVLDHALLMREVPVQCEAVPPLVRTS